MAKVIASLLVLLLAACSDNSGGPAGSEATDSLASPPRPAPPGAAAPVPGGGSLAVILPRLAGSAVGDAAALQGRLAAEGPCLYVETDAGRYLIAALAPSLTWNASAGRLGSGAAAFAVGDEIMLGGSQARPGTALAWTAAPHRTCDTRRIWIATSAAAR
ncbi:MAG TPA: hypothetical protein VE891_12255 [Allosphingosinicella sp.]|nr:hypothetical protein [Allosphingosinicella sp.]